jgi:hypothetical protein
MNGAFGRGDWAGNGVLFAAYHLHVPWAMPGALLDMFILSYPTKRYRSAWIGIAVQRRNGGAVDEGLPDLRRDEARLGVRGRTSAMPSLPRSPLPPQRPRPRHRDGAGRRRGASPTGGTG